MGEVSQMCRLLNLRLPPYQYFACLYLEQQGLRFCVDFGYENAVEKAWAHWTSRKTRA